MNGDGSRGTRRRSCRRDESARIARELACGLLNASAQSSKPSIELRIVKIMRRAQFVLKPGKNGLCVRVGEVCRQALILVKLLQRRSKSLVGLLCHSSSIAYLIIDTPHQCSIIHLCLEVLLTGLEER